MFCTIARVFVQVNNQFISNLVTGDSGLGKFWFLNGPRQQKE